VTDDLHLARFQALLLDALSRAESADEVLARLRGDPELAEYADYIASFEPRMIDVAMELTRKWGVRDGGIPQA
jgi:hypothetical protein